MSTPYSWRGITPTVLQAGPIREGWPLETQFLSRANCLWSERCCLSWKRYVALRLSGASEGTRWFGKFCYFDSV